MRIDLNKLQMMGFEVVHSDREFIQLEMQGGRNDIGDITYRAAKDTNMSDRGSEAVAEAAVTEYNRQAALTAIS